jgi:pimeloyl-ACP methyl ester carboxylesterase
VDRNRLGLMGISLGGHATWMASADPRVKVAAPCIAVSSWKWQLENRGYTQRVKNLQGAFNGVKDMLHEPEVNPRVVAAAWSKWVPGVPDRWDCQDVLAAFAPKPLLIIAGDSDPTALMPGLQVAWQKIKAAYDKAGASDHVVLNLAEHSGHTVTRSQQDAIFEWFVRWLKPARQPG